MDTSNISNLERFCNANNIPTDGVLVMTMHRDHEDAHCTVVVSFERKKFYTHYPAEMLDSYQEMRLGDLLICYRPSNPHPDDSDNTQDASPSENVFCCSNLTPYKNLNTEQEEAFKAFLSAVSSPSSSTSSSKFIFEVKENIDNGPLLAKRYWKLHKGKLIEVAPTGHRVFCYKNYKCAHHKRFYGIDLFDDSAVKNRHHMRLNPYAHLNQDLLDELFGHC